MRQQGQAILELLVVVTAVLALAWGGMWLFRWQQIKTQTQHHAALQAFRFSQTYLLDDQNSHLPPYYPGLYSYSPHQVQAYSEVLSIPTTSWTPMRTAYADQLLAPVGHWRFYSTAKATSGPWAAWTTAQAHLWPDMQVQSQLSIFVGAGHADHDEQAADRLSLHHSLWRNRAQNSAAAIHQLQPALSLIDKAWSRTEASTSWLKPWAQSVPLPYVQ